MEFADIVKFLATIIEQLRPLHWIKNLLVFLPAALAHQLSDTTIVFNAAIAFVAFSVSASGIYAINDLADEHRDRLHHRKRWRPIPSGRLSRGNARILAMLLIAASFVLSFSMLPTRFSMWLAGYVLVTFAYSFGLKKIPLVDVLVLAGLFTIRIVSGGAATGTWVSPWLLMFSLFIFGSLAFLKRFIELKDTIERDQSAVSGRGYHVRDISIVFAIGPTLGLIAVLVFMLYITGDDVRALYPHPDRLWFMVPLLLYWVSRLWLLAHRGGVHDDPIIVAVKDYSSYIVAILATVIVVSARW